MKTMHRGRAGYARKGAFLLIGAAVACAGREGMREDTVERTELSDDAEMGCCQIPSNRPWSSPITSWTLSGTASMQTVANCTGIGANGPVEHGDWIRNATPQMINGRTVCVVPDGGTPDVTMAKCGGTSGGGNDPCCPPFLGTSNEHGGCLGLEVCRANPAGMYNVGYTTYSCSLCRDEETRCGNQDQGNDLSTAYCANLQTNVDNCGTCGVKCSVVAPFGQDITSLQCDAGRCQGTYPDGGVWQQ